MAQMHKNIHMAQMHKNMHMESYIWHCKVNRKLIG